MTNPINQYFSYLSDKYAESRKPIWRRKFTAEEIREAELSAARAEGYREGVKAALAVLNMANMGDTGLAYSIEALLNGVKK